MISLKEIENIILENKKNKDKEEIIKIEKMQKLHESMINSFFKSDKTPILGGSIRKKKLIIGSMSIGSNFIIQ